MPAWAAESLPFDARHYFDIPDSENREPLYLEALLDFSYNNAVWFFEGIEKLPDFKAKGDASRANQGKVAAFIKRSGGDYGDPLRVKPEDRAEGVKIVAMYEPGFLKLEEAQRRNRCFFHPNVDIRGINPQCYLAGIHGVLAIRTMIDLGSGVECRNARIGLRLQRDIQSMANFVGQFYITGFETTVLVWCVRPVLEYPELSDAQMNEMIALLKEHYLEHKQIDPCIEAARYEYLMLRKLLGQLENGEYAKSAEDRCSRLGLKTTLPAPDLLGARAHITIGVRRQFRSAR